VAAPGPHKRRAGRAYAESVRFTAPLRGAGLAALLAAPAMALLPASAAAAGWTPDEPLSHCGVLQGGGLARDGTAEAAFWHQDNCNTEGVPSVRMAAVRPGPEAGPKPPSGGDAWRTDEAAALRAPNVVNGRGDAMAWSVEAYPPRQPARVPVRVAVRREAGGGRRWTSARASWASGRRGWPATGRPPSRGWTGGRSA
jgi:hypothetical protein